MTVSNPAATFSAQPSRLALGLSLSGGGYRAMLFHAGALWRLNEVGWLKKLDAISSVSGGSIAAGLLAASWRNLLFDAQGIATNFDDVYLAKLLAFAHLAVDFSSIGYGVAAPWTSAAKQAVKSYRRLLGRDANLNKLPDEPRFIFCSSNLTTGSLFRFEKRYIADYRLGQHFNPDLDLAVAVAASAAFPPFLSPLRLDLRGFNFQMRPVNGITPAPADPALLRRAVLTDGGVYDNHGVQPLLQRCKTLLVSDGGAPWTPSTSGFRLWGSQLKRVFDTTDNQVRALRRQDLIDRFIGTADPTLELLPPTSAVQQRYGLRGTYWGIGTHPENYPAWPHPLAKPEWRRLANIGTWLHFLGAQQTTDLINWGYVVSDLALRSYIDQSLPPGTSLPVAEARVLPRLTTRITQRALPTIVRGWRWMSARS
jgi:NTE family protein